MTSCLRLKLTCHGAAYSSDLPATGSNTAQTEISVTMPRTYNADHQPENATCVCCVATPDHPRYDSLPPISDLLSASRRDPFNTACVTDTSLGDLEHLDHAILCHSGGFSTMYKQREVDLVRSDIMSHALNEPVARYSLIYAGASHRAYVRHLQTCR